MACPFGVTTTVPKSAAADAAKDAAEDELASLLVDGRSVTSPSKMLPNRLLHWPSCSAVLMMLSVVFILGAFPLRLRRGTSSGKDDGPFSLYGDSPKCIGELSVAGFGCVHVISARINTPGFKSSPVEVWPAGVVAPRMGARAYFGNACRWDTYDSHEYSAVPLLGRTLSYTVDLSGAECGTVVAVYLGSMSRNIQAGSCLDYYCDAGNVCGSKCAELDIMEANKHVFRTTIHTQDDAAGMSDPHNNWPSHAYGPSGTCIDTNKPFHVSATFLLASCIVYDYNFIEDCGWPGMTQIECEARGCCYDETNPRFWCYAKSQQQTSCAVHEDAVLMDCGHPGITRSQCEARGCCFDDTNPKFWCYTATHQPTSCTAREDSTLLDCGQPGMTQAQCEARGCCYDETNPRFWCYTVPPQASCTVYDDSIVVDCGQPGMTQSQCEARGCCYDETNPHYWCYIRPQQAQLGEVVVSLTQLGHGAECLGPLSVRVGAGYHGLASLSEELHLGMTPIVSYWGAGGNLSWLDGSSGPAFKPCAAPQPHADFVLISNFSVV